MTTISSTATAVQTPFDDAGFDEAQLAAASFLARYSGRTLEAYRQDLRGFFQWAADHDVAVLAATRPHIELWRGTMEERGPRRLDDRPAPLDGVRLLPVRPHRRPDWLEPSGVRTPPAGASIRRSWPGPVGARHVPGRR